MLSKKIVRFLKSGFLVISIGFSMGISGCKGNTEEPVSSEPIEIVSEKGMDDNFINIPIDIYAEATTKNKLKDMETVRKVVERFGECGYAAVDCENRLPMKLRKLILISGLLLGFAQTIGAQKPVNHLSPLLRRRN